MLHLLLAPAGSALKLAEPREAATMARISSQLMSTDDLPAGWESSWEGMIGSPRFEEARETCGCLIEDLKVSVTPSSKLSLIHI